MQQNIEFRSKRKVSLGLLGRVDRQVVPVYLLVGKLQLMKPYLYRHLFRLDRPAAAKPPSLSASPNESRDTAAPTPEVSVCLLVEKLQLMNTFLYRLLFRLDLRFDATKYLISQYQKSASGLIRWSGQAGCPHAELPCCC